MLDIGMLDIGMSDIGMSDIGMSDIGMLACRMLQAGRAPRILATPASVIPVSRTSSSGKFRKVIRVSTAASVV
jgi:hypothetical protein